MLLLRYLMAASALLALPLCAPAQHDVSHTPPHGAIVLFDGKDPSAWVQRDTGKPCEWPVMDGELVIANGTGDIRTKREFGDFQLHLEFNLPLMADAKGEARANSGVYIHDLYEVQILDSSGKEHPTFVDCGAIYRQTAPTVNACKPPGTWQTYDITFRAPRFDAAGAATEKPRVTVVLNGKTVQDDTEIEGPTGARKGQPMTKTGPIVLQDHHAKVRFRNIWVRAK